MPGGRGFTLIELLITLAVLSVLATLVLPVAQIESQRVRERELSRALGELRHAIDAYKKAYDEGRIERKADATGYPPTLEVLVEGVEDVRTPDKPRIYFLRRVPRDPMSTDASVPDARTWALRSYASEPSAPAEGEDVYDVHSRSTRIGLNGQAYHRW
ncbi:type II secretion system protein [Roseateles chitinivorans]|uniref:type II secretion system protein n=1 Tax=Roseateles chitinivorans TaxID=2917965 RepID=UPI003D67FE13